MDKTVIGPSVGSSPRASKRTNWKSGREGMPGMIAGAGLFAVGYEALLKVFL